MSLLSNSKSPPPHSSVRVHFAEDDANENSSRGHLSKNGHGHGDNINDGGDNDDNTKTPDRDERRQDPVLPLLPIRKVALPIVRSKKDHHASQLLLGVDDKKSTKTIEATNGSLSSHHNNNLHEISDTANSASKIPKSLKNLVVREKIHPNVNPGRRNDPSNSSSKSPTRVNAIDLSNTNPPNTKIVVSRGVEMKRVDEESDRLPQPPVTYGSSSCNNNIKPRTATTTRKPASSSTAESSSSKNLKPVTLEPPSVRPSKPKGKPCTVVATPLPQNAPAPSATTGAGEGHPSIVLAESYKEVLNLPPVIPVSDETRHDGQQQQEEENAEPPPTKSKPTTNSYYKSKFWEYVNPKKKVPSSKPPEKPKPYDPTAPKSFVAPPRGEVKVINRKPPPLPRPQHHSVRPVIKSPHQPNAQSQRRLPMSSLTKTTTTTTTSSAAVSRSSILPPKFETMPQPSLPPTPTVSGEKRFSEKCVTTASLGELEKSSNSSSSKSSILSDNSSIISVKLRTMPPALPRPMSSSSSRKSLNEPYPPEAIQPLQQEAQVEPAVAVSRRDSLSELRKCVMLPETRPRPNLDASVLETTLTPKNSSTGLLNLRRKSESLGLGIGQPAPSISAVLFEKLKGLQSERDAITTRKSVSAMHLTPVDDDLESISSIAHTHDSQDISITDDYFGPSDFEMHHPRTLTSTPLKLLSETSLHESRQQKEHRIHHSPRKSKSPQSSREEESASTTTVETDVELGPGHGHPTTTMTTTTTPGQPSSTSALPMPALTLRYHAERERLNILEKSIQAATLYEKRQDRVAPAPVQPPPQPPVKVPTTSEIESIAKKVAEDRIKVNLAELEKEKWSNLIKQQESTQQTSSLNNNLALEVMKCQQEAAAATAEVSKLMMQVGKSFLEDRQQERIFQENRIQQQLQARISDDHVNMAAIVVAAVDEAQRIAERQRQHREALSRVTRRPHQRGEEFERVEEQEASEHQIFRFSTPSHQDVALQFPSFSSSSETPSVVGVGDDEQLEKELDQGDELSLDHLQSFVGDQPDSRFEQESSEVEMLKSLTQLSEQNDYHTSQNETPSKIEVVEESFTTKPADDQTEESVEFEASFLSEEKEPTEEGGTESSIPEVVDVDEDNRTESPLAISHIEQEEEEEEIFEHSKVESVSEVEAEVGTNISIGEFSRSKDEGDHDLASFMSDIQQSEGNDEMDKKHESQIDDNENDFIYSGAVEEEQQKDVISSPTIDQFPVSHESPGRLEEKEEDEDQGKIVPPPFNKDEEEQERSESNILVPDDKIVPIKESEDIPLFETHQASLAPPSPQEAINSVVLNQTIDPENVATSSPLEPGIVHKEGDESVPSTMDQDNNNNPESILESIGYDVDSDVGADIDVSFNADRDLSNQSGELVLSGDEEKGVAKDDDGKEEPAIKTPSSPPPSPLPIHTDHKEDGAVTPPDVSKSELMIDHLSQQTPLNVTIDNGKDNSETVVNESSPIVITLETELVKESEELSAQQLSPPPPQDFTSLLSDPENKDANSSLLSEVSDKYSESFLSDKEGEEEEADSEPRFEEESDNEESEARPGSKNAYQGERDQSPEKEENLILSPIVDSTPEDSATSSTKDEFGDEDEKGSPRTTEVDPQQIPITTTPPTLTPPATTITTTFPETQTLPQPQPSPPPEQLEDKSELFQLVTQQRQRVEDEIRELEAQISTSPSDAIDDYLSALKQEGGDARIITCPRPPPPYPPVDSVLATLHRHIDDNRMEDSEQIQRVVVEEVDRVWDEYVRTGNIKLEPQVVEGEKEEEDLEGDDFEIGDDIDASNMELFANYIHDNTVALTHLVRETIRSTLCIPELKTPVGFVDTCRRGVYALEAKEFKVPKTKDALIAAVKRAIAPIPLEPKQVNGEKPQVLKNLTTHATWTCRPMDVVENILVPEIIQDELNWVNAWPEALLLQEECKDKIIAACLKDVLQNFDQAFKNC